MPMFLSKRMKDGSLAFPKLVQLELPDAVCIEGSSLDELATRVFIEDNLLQVVRIRAEDPNVCRIGHLRLPRAAVPDPEFQEALMQYVPSLVLFERPASSDEDKNHR